jgi:chitin disaccharide deacetylase
MTRREALAAGIAALIAPAAESRAAGEQSRSLVERLGHKKEDRLLMVHADDVGMCHSVNAATTRAMTEGFVTSGSVMVPCPWFPAIAAWSREHPEADLGLHLTLTSEWRHYRWRPVAPPDQVKGLLDDEGFLWRSEQDVKKHAQAREVETEIRAQIDRARKFGMKPTHVDSHMGALFADAKFFEVYTRVSKEVGLLPMIPGPSPEIIAEASLLGLDYPKVTARLAADGFLLLDRLVLTLEGDTFEDRRKCFHDLVRGLKPGVTELIVHLAGDDEEIRNVTGNWKRRFLDYRVVTDRDTKTLLDREGVKLVGYRPLADLWRK